MSLKVLKMSATWCPPCKLLIPIFKKVEENFEDKDVEFEHIDIDSNQEMAAKYSVFAVPTIIFLKDDGTHEVIVGLAKQSDIEDKIIKLI